ncbi:MAG: DMT family transporter [Candidatus Cloacimonetes bacterium]|nr:DMT family transporter [Candidatus Cloacimonadota bacterium]
MKKIIPYLAVILAMFFWSLSFIAIKFVFRYMGPFTITFLRLLIACLIMPLLYYLLPQRDVIKRRHIPHFMLLAFFEPFIYFIGESNGMLYVQASLGAVIISLIPLITPIFAWFLIKEPLHKWGIAGTIISFMGVVLIVMEVDEAAATFKGVVLLFLAVFGAVGYGIKLRQIAMEYKPVTIVMMQTILGMLYFLPLFLIIEGKTFFGDLPPLQAFYPVLGLALFCTCGSFLLFTFAIKKIGLNNANVFSNMIPVFTVILAFIILHEAVSLRKSAGILIVVSGLFLSQIPSFRKRGVSLLKIKSFT